MMVQELLLFALAAVLLWKGADWIVDSAAAVARSLGVSELVIGLTVVAMGTSAPEFLVTANAAFRDMADISLSNVVGSNIFNLGFILGLMAMIRPLPTSRTLVFRDGLLLWLSCALILVVALVFGVLDRWFGIVLLGLLAAYLGWLFYKRKPLPGEPDIEHREATKWDYPKLAAGFVAIALGGHFMVDAASSLAVALGVSRWVVGVTIVAAGTSLPELVTCLAASVKGRNSMLLGNLIGSDFFNFAGVLGLTCVLRPLTVAPEAAANLVTLVAMVALVLFFMRTGWRVNRTEGAALLLINLVRWGNDFLF